ncbi:hypothetical protein [Achromobacter anxifer]|uniref:hypothetical protein n=1 Tax=Achromobacter anxifer TaxID=1287737 RepID=UPI0023F73724|nr:hypothetical protein [Achromobacter anxifer]MDF8360190.1 hypothetical protein [Achromobacter anxifer]
MDADEIRFKQQEIRIERWKLLISILMSLVLLGLTWIVDNAVKERGAFLERQNQILREKQRIYSNLGSNLNIIYVYVSDIGDYAKYTPLDVIGKKRDVDRQFWSYRPYWSDRTERCYLDFLNAAFQTYVGEAEDARLKASKSQKAKALGPGWQSAWDKHFTGAKDPTIEDRYYSLVSSLLADTVSVEVRTIHAQHRPGECVQAG